MKTISQTQAPQIPFQGWTIILQYINRATRLYRLGREIADEVCATVAGVFGMPLRHRIHDKGLDRLDDQLLTDIGYKRVRLR